MTEIESHTHTSSAKPSARARALPLLPIAAGDAMFWVCCGLPIFASMGVTGAFIGLAKGHWVVVAVASIAAVIGVLRLRRRRTCQSSADSTAGRVATPATGVESLRHPLNVPATT